mmetsp:Transcript_9361/g.24034  ORF Transcript_9361/g.24034 Transcript_9361/m.24034 type:complete len:268 (+) Transcript_9361:2227-3030(+)
MDFMQCKAKECDARTRESTNGFRLIDLIALANLANEQGTDRSIIRTHTRERERVAIFGLDWVDQSVLACKWTCSLILLPSLLTTTWTTSPTSHASSTASTSSASLTGFPLTARISSPRTTCPVLVRLAPQMPARSAPEPGTTLSTVAPSSPSLRACWWTAPKLTPRAGRVTLPYRMSWLTTCRTVSAGTAKPMPELAPEGERMAVLTPTSRPDESSRGPPEFPGLMAASVWTTPRMVRPVTPWMSRPTPDTMPLVSVWSSPNGLPIA